MNADLGTDSKEAVNTNHKEPTSAAEEYVYRGPGYSKGGEYDPKEFLKATQGKDAKYLIPSKAPELPNDVVPVSQYYAQAGNMPHDVIPVSEYHGAEPKKVYDRPAGPSEAPFTRGIGVNDIRSEQLQMRKNAAGNVEVKFGDSYKELSPDEFDWLKKIGHGLEAASEIGSGIGAAVVTAPAAVASGPFAPAVEAAGVASGAALGKGANNIIKHILGIEDPHTRGQMMDMAQSWIENYTAANMGQAMGTAFLSHPEVQQALSGGKNPLRLLAEPYSNGPPPPPGSSPAEQQIIQGYKAQQQQAAQRKQLATEVGGKLTPDQLHGAPAPSFSSSSAVNEMNAYRAQQQADFASKFDAARRVLSAPIVSEGEKMNFGAQKFADIRQAHDMDVKQFIEKARAQAGDRTFFGVDPLLNRWRGVLESYGAEFGPNGRMLKRPPQNGMEGSGVMAAKYEQLYRQTRPGAFGMSQAPGERVGVSPSMEFGSPNYPSGSQRPNAGDLTRGNLPPTAGGQAERGITLKALDQLTQDAQKFSGEFGNKNRPKIEQDWAQIAHESRVARDAAAAELLEARGNPIDAARLRAARGRYQANIDMVNHLEYVTRKDPTNIAGALIDPKNPADTLERWNWIQKNLSHDEVKSLRGGFLDSLIKNNVTGQAPNAAALEQQLNSVDPKVLRAVFGEAGTRDIKKLVEYGKIIQSTPESQLAKRDSTFRLFTNVLTRQRSAMHGGADMLKSLVETKNSPTDFINGQVIDYLTKPPAVTRAERQGAPIGKAVNALQQFIRSE